MKFSSFFISLASTFIVLILHNLGCFQVISLAILDLYFRSKPEEAIDSRIIIVQITESDINFFGRYPFNDSQWLKILDRINQGKPAVIGFDIFRDFPVSPGERSFAAFLATQPNIIGITHLHAIGPHPALKNSGRYGDVTLPLDVDGVARRAFLWAYPKSQPDTSNFGLKIASLYLADRGVVPQDSGGYLKLGKAVFTPLTVNFGDYVNLTEGGYQIFLNWRKANFKILSVQDVFSHPISEFKDRIVLLGVGNTQSVKDLHDTPFGKRPGVEYQAHLISQIIAAASDGRYLLRSLSQEVEWLWIFFCGFGIGVCLRIVFERSQPSPNLQLWYLALFWSAWSLILITTTYLSFIYGGWWLPIVPAWLNLSTIGLSTLMIFYIEQLKSYLRERNLQFRKARDYYQLQGKIDKFFEQLEENINLILLPTIRSINFSGRNFQPLLEELSDSIEELNGLKKQYPLLDEFNLEHIRDLIAIIDTQQDNAYDFIDRAILELSKFSSKNCTYITPTFSTPQTLDLFLRVIIQKLHDMYESKGFFLTEVTKLNILSLIELPAHQQFRIDLLHLITNLLDNSVRALSAVSQDSPLIQVKSWSQGSKLFLEIYDNGIGIEQSQINEVFEPFMSYWIFPRIGFGLTKCKRIVESYRGKIVIESESRQFTKVKIELMIPSNSNDSF